MMWLVAVTAAFVAVPAFRVQKAPAGEVDLLYNWGAPASAKPGLSNPRRDDGCFPGMRTVAVKKKLLGWKMDKVVAISKVLAGFEHPVMDLGEIDQGSQTTKVRKCSPKLVKEPSTIGILGLHWSEDYLSNFTAPNKFMADVALFGCRTSFAQDFGVAKEQVSKVGWNLAGSALYPGSGGKVGGPQPSHLVQNPDTLDCVVTFQGTSSKGDWYANLDAKKVSFCGVAEKVHKGFRDQLMRMVKHADWQSKIRTQLPKCARVIATGHSLGGSMAELFTACVQRAPNPEDDPEGDYQALSWSKGVAGLIE